MRAAKTQRQTVERADVFARMCVVEPVGAKGPEEVEGGEGGMARPEVMAVGWAVGG
jgi:hypothetical protein